MQVTIRLVWESGGVGWSGIGWRGGINGVLVGLLWGGVVLGWGVMGGIVVGLGCDPGPGGYACA
jgi:hypothetical protein